MGESEKMRWGQKVPCRTQIWQSHTAFYNQADQQWLRLNSFCLPLMITLHVILIVQSYTATVIVQNCCSKLITDLSYTRHLALQLLPVVHETSCAAAASPCHCSYSTLVHPPRRRLMFDNSELMNNISAFLIRMVQQLCFSHLRMVVRQWSSICCIMELLWTKSMQ